MGIHNGYRNTLSLPKMPTFINNSFVKVFLCDTCSGSERNKFSYWFIIYEEGYINHHDAWHANRNLQLCSQYGFDNKWTAIAQRIILNKPTLFKLYDLSRYVLFMKIYGKNKRTNLDKLSSYII